VRSDDELIHRVMLSRRELDQISPTGTTELHLPFELKQQWDGRGKIRGLAVENPSSPLAAARLGLAPGDIITAVGTNVVREEKDFFRFGPLLRSQGSATLTFERSGQPHKAFYYLRD
jgi:S1-C subfamily serine protease